MRRVSCFLVALAVTAANGCGAVPVGQGDTSGARTSSPSGSPSSPPVACSIAAHPPAIGGLVYLKGRNEVLLFGGDDATNSPIAETWMLSSGCWKKIVPTASPSPRDLMAIAFDVTRGLVILYGGRAGGPGQTGSFLHDTWTWDGQTWTQVTTAGPALINPAAAYDPISNQVIMFGPTHQGGEAQTWAWTGGTWTLLHPTVSPSGRDAASIAFDSATGQLVLFGGEQTLGPIGETWTWTGSTWRQLLPGASPSPRLLAALGPNGSSPGLVLYGGGDFSHAYHDTWIWNGTSWHQVTPAHAPPEGVGAPVATDTQLELVGKAGEVWTWSGIDWYQVA